MATQHNTTLSSIRKAIEPNQSLFRFSLFSLVGAGLGIAIAAAMLYNLVISGSNRQLADTVFNAHATAYANHINQAVGQLQNQLNHLSNTPALATSFQNGSAKALAKQEKSLIGRIVELTNIRLIPVSEQILTPTQTQLSFPEIDMINRASRGEKVAAESHPANKQPVIRLVSTVKDGTAKKIIGVVIATFNIKAISHQLALFDTADGAMKIEQTYKGKTPQSFYQKGADFNDQQTVVTVPLQNPLWQIRFQPSEQLAHANNLSPVAFWAPILLALSMVLFSILYAYLRLRNNARADAVELVNYCRQLIQNDAGQLPTFKLSLFHSMAKTLSETEREQTIEARVSSKDKSATDQAASTTDTAESSDNLHAELDEDDLLDLDLINAEANSNDAQISEPEAAPHTRQLPQRDIPKSIFRAYDIRGIVDDTLDTDIAYRIGQAVGSQASDQGEKGVIVGADGRLSSPELSAALIRGIRDSGQDVINIGTVPTPLVYFATHCLETSSGIMITGSHNPANYNGFKIVIAGKTLANEEIQALYQRIVTNDFTSGHGELDNIEIIDDYTQHVNSDIALAKPLKVVLDCGNGVASVVAPKLLEDIGCTVIPLHCEMDGTFPNHHPDPSKPENLQDVINAIAEHDADIGLAFDGDGDRLGVVTNAGNIIWPDRLMMLFSKDIASRNPGADIIYDVKCSRRLAGLISSYGGRPIMWKTGHSLIKAKMQETGALLAGEMSGHIFFKERWFGFDDGIYSAARLLEIVGSEAMDSETLFEGFPDDVSTPEINVNVTDENKFSLVEQLQQQASFDGADVSTIDGVRADFENGWGLVRASNTTPVLVLRFGAEDETELSNIQAHFKRELLAIAPDLDIPF